MWGLAYKDLLLMRRSLWYYAFLLVIFTAFVLTGSLDAYILSGMAMLFSYMVPLSSFSLDEAARWGPYAAATPACLRGIVDGKYLCSLLTAAGGGGAAALLICLCAALGRLGDPLGEVLLSCLFCTGLALAMEAVLLPSPAGGHPPGVRRHTGSVAAGAQGPAGPARPDPRRGRRPGLGGRRPVRAGLRTLLAHRPADLRQKAVVKSEPTQ